MLHTFKFLRIVAVPDGKIPAGHPRGVGMFNSVLRSHYV